VLATSTGTFCKAAMKQTHMQCTASAAQQTGDPVHARAACLKPPIPGFDPWSVYVNRRKVYTYA
jgi:hypothetical protein